MSIYKIDSGKFRYDFQSTIEMHKCDYQNIADYVATIEDSNQTIKQININQNKVHEILNK